LEAKGNVIEGSMKHIEFLYDIGRMAGSTPAIAFGSTTAAATLRDTLEIRLRPFVSAIRRSRAYTSAGIRRALAITAAIYEQKKFSDIPSGDQGFGRACSPIRFHPA